MRRGFGLKAFRAAILRPWSSLKKGVRGHYGRESVHYWVSICQNIGCHQADFDGP